MDTYEKKYKEALEKARQLCAYPTSKPFISDLQDLFPELTESNDERIRKELIDAILGLWDNDALPMPLSVKRKDEWIAWLEKQGEEKTVNYPIEGMFPYTDHADTLDGEIENIWNKLRNCDNTFTAAKSGFYEVIHHFANWLEKQGEQKPVSKEYTFKSIPRLLDMIEPTDRAKAYCQKLIDTLAKEEYNTDAKIVEGVLKGWNGEDVPMAVMDEKQGEQKPADKAKPFDKYEGLTDFERTLADICIGWIGEELGWKQYIKDNANVLLKIAIEKFNSVQDTPFEQKPIIEMKSAEESLGISSEEYNDIVNEYLYGESESSDKVELKFKVGDWITNGDYTWKIIEVKPLDYILQSQDGNIVDDTISHVDEQFHSFSIEDAKDGDVLASELCDSIILFRGIKDDNIDFYCDYDFSKIDIPGDRFTVNNGQHYGNVEDSKDFYPATKEQRDILFSKMHEAGYEWNAEKKELKKISQRMISAEAKEALYDKPTDEEMKELLRTEYEKGRADTIAEMKSSWSEEDEKQLMKAIWYVDNPAPLVLKDTMLIEWLKQLKQRIGG